VEVRILRYVLATLFVVAGLALVWLPLGPVLRGEGTDSPGGLWLLEVALGIPAFAVAVWLWPPRRSKDQQTT
jgi:hypothetical protein